MEIESSNSNDQDIDSLILKVATIDEDIQNLLLVIDEENARKKKFEVKNIESSTDIHESAA